MDTSDLEVSTSGNERKACWRAGRAVPCFGRESLWPWSVRGKNMPAPHTIYSPRFNQQWENPHDRNVFFGDCFSRHSMAGRQPTHVCCYRHVVPPGHGRIKMNVKNKSNGWKKCEGRRAESGATGLIALHSFSFSFCFCFFLWRGLYIF